MTDPDTSNLLAAVPLLPLPNVVLFPKAVLPLHIFEERYKLMTAHALEGDRRVAMALLKPGWETNYYSKPAIEAVVCVGRILTFEKLPDGKYNFLLQGETRARILREVLADEPYRLAELQPLAESGEVMEIDLGPERQRFAELFEHGVLGGTSIGRQFRQLIGGPPPTSVVADLIAFNFLEDVRVKQALLAEQDVRRRVARTIDAMERMRPALQAAHLGGADDHSMN